MRFIVLAVILSGLCLNGQQVALPRYNQVYQVATHNSYWVKRARHELYASGTQGRLLDQLHFDHVRALEIDIHKIKNKPGQWAVYHTSKSANAFYENLTDFLKQLQQFQYSLPMHEVVTVVLELKEVFSKNFDEDHTPAQLDSILETYMGNDLFRPRDLKKRCPGSTTLCDCAKSSVDIWPTTQELRGKFIFLVLGNLHFGPFGHGGLGWATYANSENPSAFPMSSDFSRFGHKHGWKEYVPADMLSRAFQASIFQQVEWIHNKEHLAAVSKFIAAGGIVRGGSSFSRNEQQERINSGFHLLQTDYPWIQINHHGFDKPFRPLDSTRFNDPSVFIEPGERIFIPSDSETVWSRISADSINFWETLPSSTRYSPDKNFPNPFRTEGKGCLTAMSAEGLNYISICRKVNIIQNAVITIKVVAAGVTSTKKFTTNNRSSGLVGDYIAMRIEQHAGSGQSKVSLFSSSEMMYDSGSDKLIPKWSLLENKTLNFMLPKQGLQATQGPVLFVGSKRNGKYVTPKELIRQ